MELIRYVLGPITDFRPLISRATVAILANQYDDVTPPYAQNDFIAFLSAAGLTATKLAGSSATSHWCLSLSVLTERWSICLHRRVRQALTE
jgi:hypothetical protein